jgi:hypothetical protein
LLLGLHWEAGAVGQVLYLEAEYCGMQGTGIGCYFDDLSAALLGIDGPPAGTPRQAQDSTSDARVLYHFAFGAGAHDARVRTLPGDAFEG